MEQKCIIRNQLLVWQVLINTSLREKSSLCQGFPIVCALLGTRHHSRRWACGASSVFIAAPHCSHYCLSSGNQVQGYLLIMHYGELCNYFIIYHNIIIIEIKCTINAMCLKGPKTIPHILICGKIVFHETSPWCQKSWRYWSSRQAFLQWQSSVMHTKEVKSLANFCWYHDTGKTQLGV